MSHRRLHILVALLCTGLWAGAIWLGHSSGHLRFLDRLESALSDVRTLLRGVKVPPDLVTLTVEKQGQGTGTVTSNPPGINCGLACQFSIQRGTTVTLTATPDEGSSFNDWHGGPCNNSSSVTCQLVMDTDQTVSAHFDDDD